MDDTIESEKQLSTQIGNQCEMCEHAFQKVIGHLSKSFPFYYVGL